MNEEKYKKERIEYIADKISPYTVAGCDEDLAEAIFNLVEEENARLKDKIEKAINLLEKHNCENCCDYNDMIALAELKDMKFDERNFELIDKKF